MVVYHADSRMARDMPLCACGLWVIERLIELIIHNAFQLLLSVGFRMPSRVAHIDIVSFDIVCCLLFSLFFCKLNCTYILHRTIAQ
jgi:hypothetical protein